MLQNIFKGSKFYMRFLYGWLLWCTILSCTDSVSQQDAQFIKSNIGKLPFKFTKHALCRMACRHIDEQEIAAVLTSGNINYEKSDTRNTQPCRKKYAIEGTTKDGQRVRIIVAPCRNQLTIITVIDLGVDWKCNCH